MTNAYDYNNYGCNNVGKSRLRWLKILLGILFLFVLGISLFLFFSEKDTDLELKTYTATF